MNGEQFYEYSILEKHLETGRRSRTHSWLGFFTYLWQIEEENDLPWDYEKIVRQYLKRDLNMMDYDTGGEFLLSLNHPYSRTAATEGYPPNVELCSEKLLPLGINFRECQDPSKIPFPDESFDLVINRHGDFDVRELFRLLRQNGLFITEQRKRFDMS